ncbi:MAG: extensin-like protein [Maritimibacter sp.]|nr:extensin-like protein [Maritimibacter sp.]
MGTGLIAALFATTLAAEAPTRSLIPKPRPGGQAAQQAPAVVNDPIANLVNNILKPRPRPGANTQVQQMTAAGTGSYTRLAVARSLVPKPRPQNLVRRNTVQRTGMAQSGDDARRVTRAGSVCGRPEIKGVKLQSIPGRVNGCGVSEPVKVTSVSGVALSQPITVDCQTAVVFNAWVGQALVPLTKRLGGGVQEVTIFASYACRTRNNQRGAKISEHGRGHAVDVGGFTLANGVELTVLDHWNDPQHGSLMQQLHRVACGPFGTVLGPKSDRFHKNHFHFDTARYRSGSYCR